MNAMSSRAKTFVGSAIATASELPIFRTGMTSYFLGVGAGPGRRTGGSIASWASVIEGTPYGRERNPISCSSLMKPSLMRIEPSFSVEPRCSPRAFWSCAGVRSPSATSRSPSRRLTGCPSFWCACAISFYCTRSEEHTSELQSQSNLVCRLLLEKKKFHETNLDLTRPLPPLNLYDPDFPVYTHRRFLPRTTINDCTVTASILCYGSSLTNSDVHDSACVIRRLVRLYILHVH